MKVNKNNDNFLKVMFSVQALESILLIGGLMLYTHLLLASKFKCSFREERLSSPWISEIYGF